LSLDPDYEKAMANSCSWELNYGQKTIARKLALQLIEKYPGNDARKMFTRYGYLEIA
jgi:hypothetical protein